MSDATLGAASRLDRALLACAVGLIALLRAVALIAVEFGMGGRSSRGDSLTSTG